jgi:predicted dehydrogenase
MAVCGRTMEVAVSFAASLDIECSYVGLSEMIQGSRFEVLHVCTPNNLHLVQTLTGLDAGLHVVCEKPLATSIEDSARAVEAARKHARIGVTAHHSRGYPMVRHMREIVREGLIGAPTYIHGWYSADIAFSAPTNWRRVARSSGPSYVTADLGTHWFDLVEHVTGSRIVEVCADFGQFGSTRRDAGEDYAGVLCRLDSGAAAVGHFSAISAGSKSDCVFACEGKEGGVTWSGNSPNELILRSKLGPNRLVTKDDLPDGSLAVGLARLPAGLVEGYLDAVENIFRSAYRAMAGEDGEEYPSFVDGQRSLVVVDAVIRSAHGKEWVSVPST